MGCQRRQGLKKTLLHTESNLRHWLAGGFFYPDFYPDFFQERQKRARPHAAPALSQAAPDGTKTHKTHGKSAAGGARTPDLRLRRPLLYPTELLPHRARRTHTGHWTPDHRQVVCALSCNPILQNTRYRPRISPFYTAGRGMLVGARGFEPPTSCSQSKRATGLRYAPKSADSTHIVIVGQT